MRRVGNHGAVQPPPGEVVADILRNLGATIWAPVRRPRCKRSGTVHKVTHREARADRPWARELRVRDDARAPRERRPTGTILEAERLKATRSNAPFHC